MKKMKKLILVATLFSLLISCKKDDNSNDLSVSIVNTTVSSGTWRITYYWDTDHEETNSFANYVFTFGASNVLTAVKTGSNILGTWSTGTDDSKVKLILNFTSPSSFSELSDDWHVTERTDTKIKLQDVSGGNGGIDYLTFEKN
jgi:hypothetical protein